MLTSAALKGWPSTFRTGSEKVRMIGLEVEQSASTLNSTVAGSAKAAVASFRSCRVRMPEPSAACRNWVRQASVVVQFGMRLRISDS
jgi:hypothetical protein